MNEIALIVPGRYRYVAFEMPLEVALIRKSQRKRKFGKWQAGINQPSCPVDACVQLPGVWREPVGLLEGAQEVVAAQACFRCQLCERQGLLALRLDPGFGVFKCAMARA